MLKETQKPETDSEEAVERGLDRRQFLGGVSGLTAVGLSGALAGGAAGITGLGLAALGGQPARAEEIAPAKGAQRAEAAYKVRVEAAERQRKLGIPEHPTNGDEELYPSRIGNFHKTLPHNEFGEVDKAAYDMMHKAIATGDFKALDAVPGGGRFGFQDAIGGLAFNLDGPDSAAIATPPPPPIASREYATQLAELYWMSVLHDVPHLEYPSSPLVKQACEDLSRLSGNPGPRDPTTGKVTPQTLFRAPYPGVTDGPPVSQILLQRFRYDGIPINPKISTNLAGGDFLTHPAEWLDALNGFVKWPPQEEPRDPVSRFIRNGRDLARLSAQDDIYSLYLRSFIVLAGVAGVRTTQANPYMKSNRQFGFPTFGAAHLAQLLGGVHVARNAFYVKWNVHRYLRPEQGGGLVHFLKTGKREYPIHDDLMKSPVLDLRFEANQKVNKDRLGIEQGSYLLPQMTYGAPTHPSYVSVHATFAGACITILKAWYDETVPWPEPVQPNADGTELIPYVAGKDGPPLTIGGELNKLCSNITFGRNSLGVHYRVDSEQGNHLGEECALRTLAEQKATVPQPSFSGFTLTRFNGEKVTV
ncbi:MAG TPA: phosphoesterase [Thermoanaerobaculia bacterium]|nr:phosphoesterase [Thermoanaerobaculia bacterium]